MSSYIFITNEGYTYQPESESIEPDIENCQVIGFANGKTSKDAFENLIAENQYLKETSFNNVICIELKHENYESKQEIFYIH